MAVSFRRPRNPGPYVWNIICVSLLLSMLVALEINMYNITTFDTIFAYPFAAPLYRIDCIRGTVILCPVHPAHFLFGHQRSTLP
ncbi:hypothetical protein C8F04DRAFT_1139524 [Mycena alexandri]|uniref:Uncharacterized protein n=1 Tax=Mycena alexandri TaxID=1745969 RepID=A0AAD6S6W0_9AGAR|nr:hypothetical protein C8F04DRAFT_1139524 [Mycena alexandri]